MEVGELNRRGQQLLGKTHELSPQYHPRRDDLPKVYIWEMRCDRCGHEYGANNCDAWCRKCPKCQKGRPGVKRDKT